MRRDMRGWVAGLAVLAGALSTILVLSAVELDAQAPAAPPPAGPAPAAPQPTGQAPAAPIAPGPVQPIVFSHLLHAGEFKIDCQYCHADARRSSYAGIPSVKRCMGCHIIAGAAKPEVQKLQAYLRDVKPIPWVRIHKVQGYVYFPHKRHVRTDVTCQTCHGQVQAMAVMAQVAPLTMGWCVECHAARGAPLDCVVCHH